MKMPILVLIALFLSSCQFSCSQKKLETVPGFDPDRAYRLILEYEKWGPKVPGTPEHRNAGNWIVETMKSMGLEVLEQNAESTGYDGKKVPIRNILARSNPKKNKRVLLSAHWDNRPFADQDKKNKTLPVPGVNDGGSGVVILMGVAHALSSSKTLDSLDAGVDFAFWDAEDGGSPQSAKSYCLGSQYWARNPVPENYRAEFGINFDMVGRMGSLFPIEAYSLSKAGSTLIQFRASAQKIGYGDFFPEYQVGPVVDDHYFVSEGRGFPMMDLIAMNPDGTFPPEWHTLEDTSKVISRDVLKVVGQTTLQFLFDHL